MNKQHSRYRWFIFFSVLLVYCLIVSQRTAPGLITDQLMEQFNVKASTMGMLPSIQFLAYALLQIPVGILVDRYGPNRFFISGALLTGIGTFCYSMAPNAYILIGSRLLVGIGDATVWVSLVLILSQWFRAREFNHLLGFAAVGGNFGFLLATYPFSVWIYVAGWRSSFFTMGLLLVVLGMMLYVILVRVPQRFIAEETYGKEALAREGTFQQLRRIMKERQAWATFLCHFGIVGPYVGFIGSWAVPYGMEMYDMSRSAASQLVMIGLFGGMIGAPLSSFISSKLHSIKKTYMIILSIIFLSWLSFFIFNGKPPFYVVTVIFFCIGYGTGAAALTFVAIRQYFAIQEVGLVTGFANAGGYLSAVLLPSLFGSVLDLFAGEIGGFHYGFLIPIIFSSFGLFGSLLLIEEKVGANKSVAKVRE